MSHLGRCPSSCHGITKRSQFSSQFAQSETTYTHPNEATCRKLTPPGWRPESALADTGREWYAVIYETKPFSLPTRTNGNHLTQRSKAAHAGPDGSYAGAGNLVA